MTAETSSALGEALAEALYEHANVLPPILWPPHSRPRTVHLYRSRAEVLIAGPLAALLAEHAAQAAEIARLKADLQAAIHEVSVQARLRGEAEGRLCVSEAAGIVEGWRDRALAAEAALAAAPDRTDERRRGDG